ncbi:MULTISPECIES: sortase domain-containing protein, partial [unclassified Streptomyces]
MRTTGHHGVWTAVAAACAFAAALAIAFAAVDRAAPPPSPTVAGTIPSSLTEERAARPSAAPLPRARPTRVTIPALGLKATLQPVGLTARSQLPLPADPTRASWLSSSAAPGENGTAVLAGHVDTDKGPAAFYQLSAATTGMRIDVSRADGATARFVVTAVAVYPRSHFPHSVYEDTFGPSLHLITCTGWDNTAKVYRDNVVVYATLNGSTENAPSR